MTDSGNVKNAEKPQTKMEFYQSQVERAKYVLKQIEQKGIDALHEIDKSKGVKWAKETLNNDMEYFQNKIKELMEKEKMEFLKDRKCSVCQDKATKRIQVIWKGKQKFIPRCDKHVTDGYKGEIIEEK